MTEREKPQPELSLFSAAPPAEEGKPWVAIVFAAVIVVMALGLMFLVWHGPRRTASSGPPPYAAQLVLSGTKTAQMQNFLGANVTYLEGTVSNSGDKTVTAATVEVTFSNSLNEVVQKEEMPMTILSKNGPYPEAVDLRISPLGARQTREFRLTFEHISADWNQQQPALRITELTLR